MTDETAAHLVRVHIDREAYHSPNPTTGKALYALGHVANHRELFREVEGDSEDILVPRNGERVHLKKDEHFYSQKTVTILVNGEPAEVVETKISFDEVARPEIDHIESLGIPKAAIF